MLFVVLAALAGLVWGVGDFAGGKAAQRAHSLAVTVASKLLGLPVLAVYAVIAFVPVAPAGLAWGAAAGCAGLVGLVLFYAALSAGAMTVVAPVTAVTSAALPVVVGLAQGESPGALRLLGVLCALVAIALVSLAPRRPGQSAPVTSRLVADGGRRGHRVRSVLHPHRHRREGPGRGRTLARCRLPGVDCRLGGLVALLRRPEPWPRGRALAWTALAGPFDMTSNALYLYATRLGELSLVAPLAALYPVTTVILAMIIDRERVRSVQVFGLALALAALLLVAS